MLTRAVCILPNHPGSRHTTQAVCILPDSLGSLHTAHFLAHGQYRYSGNMLTDTVSDIASASHLSDAEGGGRRIKCHSLT